MSRRKTDTPASRGARATSCWRERQARRSFVVPAELFNYEVEALIRLGFLERTDLVD